MTVMNVSKPLKDLVYIGPLLDESNYVKTVLTVDGDEVRIYKTNKNIQAEGDVVQKYRTKLDSRLFSSISDCSKYNFLCQIFHARSMYEIAHFVGVDCITNDVQIYLDEEEWISGVESYFGEALGPVTGNMLEEALDIREWKYFDPHKETYAQLVNKFGELFILGDIFRVCFNELEDSHWSRNIRIVKETNELRWIDYGNACTQTRAYRTLVLDYLLGHREYLTYPALKLIGAIATIGDEQIESIVESVYGAHTKKLLADKISRDMKGTEATQMTQEMNEHFDLLKEIHDARCKMRREVFKELYRELALVESEINEKVEFFPTVRENFIHSFYNTADRVVEKKQELEAMIWKIQDESLVAFKKHANIAYEKIMTIPLTIHHVKDGIMNKVNKEKQILNEFIQNIKEEYRKGYKKGIQVR